MKESKRPHDIDKWRWEFMRNNEEVKKDFKEILGLREKVMKRLKKKRFKGSVEDHPREYFGTEEHAREMELRKKHEIHLPFFPNPDKSFDEIMQEQTKETDGPFFRATMKSTGVSFISKLHDPKRLKIEIDFEKVNSVKELIDSVSQMIHRHLDRLPKRKQHYKNKDGGLKKDYAEILRIVDIVGPDLGDWEWKAKAALPEKYNSKDELKARSAIKTVENAVKEYRRLRDGGYKELAYP